MPDSKTEEHKYLRGYRDGVKEAFKAIRYNKDTAKDYLLGKLATPPEGARGLGLMCAREDVIEVVDITNDKMGDE